MPSMTSSVWSGAAPTSTRPDEKVTGGTPSGGGSIEAPTVSAPGVWAAPWGVMWVSVGAQAMHATVLAPLS